MKISMIGTGYVGLVTGSSLANIGHDVTCIDNNEMLIENLKDAIVPFYEKDLEDLIKKQINKKLKFSLFDSDIIKNSEIILIQLVHLQIMMVLTSNIKIQLEKWQRF